MLSVPMKKANEKKTEFWSIVAVVVALLALVGVIWFVAGRAIDANIVEYSKYY